MHVRCVNCGMVYDVNNRVKVCLKCKSNATEPVDHSSIGRKTEGTKPSGRRLLCDDMPSIGMGLLG